jgi:hypothetical protein
MRDFSGVEGGLVSERIGALTDPFGKIIRGCKELFAEGIG